MTYQSSKLHISYTDLSLYATQTLEACLYAQASHSLRIKRSGLWKKALIYEAKRNELAINFFNVLTRNQENSRHNIGKLALFLATLKEHCYALRSASMDTSSNGRRPNIIVTL